MADLLPGQYPDTATYGTGLLADQFLEVANASHEEVVYFRVFASNGRGMATELDFEDARRLAAHLLRLLGYDLDALVKKADAWDEAVSSGLLDDETAAGLLGEAS